MKLTYSPDSLLRVGWREWLSLPDLGVPAIKAKVDTGARTSCIHAFDIETFEEDGKDFVSFMVAPLREHSHFMLQCRAPLVDERYITDSGGHRTLRPIIQTLLVVQGAAWPIKISLADRRKMKFPMLLGRTAMRRKIVVDPAASYLNGRALPHTYRDKGMIKKEHA